MKTLLLEALACPKCHQLLQYDAQQKQLICEIDKLIYPIKDGIPVLLESEAKPISE